MAPSAGTRPAEGFQPVTPQQWAGMRTEPPVSEPRATKAAPLATAAAEPDDEPPGAKSGFQGLRAVAKPDGS